MADSRFTVSTFRIPREVHIRMKQYVKEYNAKVKWDEVKMSFTVLIGKALEEYMGRNPLGKVIITHKNVYGYRQKKGGGQGG